VKIHLIHGIHTNGPNLVEGLIEYLKEWDVRYPEYGYILGLETRIVNPIIVGTVAPYVEPGDIIIGHSNGGAIAYELANRTKPGGIILINAALEQNITRNAPWIDVYYNPGDEITEAAKWGAELGVDDKVWGEMGHAGYIGNDPLIYSTNCASMGGAPVALGHSAIFLPGNIEWWGVYLAGRLRAHLALHG
jgi:hypothetical protein